jgi:putative sporulation protein YyaC
MENNMTSFYYNAFEQGAAGQLTQALNQTIQPKENGDLILLCIGTDRATGDCLGPLVGEQLQAMLPSLPIYGTLAQPIHAMNLEETMQQIYENHPNPFIIAVDASLGIPEHIGYATLTQAPLVPGKGVHKKLPAIGHLSITGIVNVAGFPNSILLQSTRLHTVMTLANCISDAIYGYFLEEGTDTAPPV